MQEKREGRVALFGYPLGHSVSPAMHHSAAVALGLMLHYELWPLQVDALSAALATLRGETWLGANVTLPHKPTIAGLVDECSILARRIGAVNTIYKREHRLLGENTDAPAFIRSLREQLDLQPTLERVIVLGAGGASRACVLALADAGVRQLAIWNRSVERAEEMRRSLLPALDKFTEEGGQARVLHDEQDMNRGLSEATLVVNATSAGLDGHGVPLADLSLLRAARVYDLVYGIDETPLVRQGRQHGLRSADGLWMLVYQAAAAFELWTGVRPPEQRMYDAARAALVARQATERAKEVAP